MALVLYRCAACKELFMGDFDAATAEAELKKAFPNLTPEQRQDCVTICTPCFKYNVKLKAKERKKMY
jgi:hypothetical protein